MFHRLPSFPLFPVAVALIFLLVAVFTSSLSSPATALAEETPAASTGQQSMNTGSAGAIGTDQDDVLGEEEGVRPTHETSHVCDPDDPNYSFDKFYAAMERRGIVIFPGRLTSAHTFRIGTMGDLTDSDMSLIIDAVLESMAEIGVTNTVPKAERVIAA